MGQDFNVVAVDVGTTSVRLAIIGFRAQDHYKRAHLIASQEQDINHVHRDGDKFEQNSHEIFRAICDCSKRCLSLSNVPPGSIKSIAFSATCSLVIHEAYNSTDKSTTQQQSDVIMWMDHRAIEQAERITRGGSRVLDQFGGVCSPEFTLAKLLWLKEHARDRLEAAQGLFELPDWLVYRCIGGDAAACPRSVCSLACKWGYNVDTGQHCDIIRDQFQDHSKMRANFAHPVLKPGTVSGFMSAQVASELGLAHASATQTTNRPGEQTNRTQIAVGTSLIDAHAGMLAMLSISMQNYGIETSVESTFCSLAGTSTCHMLLSKERHFTPGVWGPYKNVVLDEHFLLEAGQSLTGKLIEICIENTDEGKNQLATGKTMKQIIQSLNGQIELTKQWRSRLHVLPTYHGNRSPLANPRLRGGIYGLSTGPQSLLDHYIAHVESIAFETKFILERLSNVRLSSIFVSGGLMKNKFYMQTLANVLGCRAVKLSLKDVDFMVMGASLVARCAALNAMDNKSSLESGLNQEPLNEQNISNMQYEQLEVEIYEPVTGKQKSYLKEKYECYKEFVRYSQRVDEILHPH